jgi:hypothetical protein
LGWKTRGEGGRLGAFLRIDFTGEGERMGRI